MAPGYRPFLQESVVTAVVHCHLVLRQIQLHDPGDAAGQELTVMGYQHDAAAELAVERADPLSPLTVVLPS